jgi:hypothetical protein
MSSRLSGPSVDRKIGSLTPFCHDDRLLKAMAALPARLVGPPVAGLIVSDAS